MSQSNKAFQEAVKKKILQGNTNVQAKDFQVYEDIVHDKDKIQQFYETVKDFMDTYELDTVELSLLNVITKDLELPPFQSLDQLLEQTAKSTGNIQEEVEKANLQLIYNSRAGSIFASILVSTPIIVFGGFAIMKAVNILQHNTITAYSPGLFIIVPCVLAVLNIILQVVLGYAGDLKELKNAKDRDSMRFRN